MNLQNQIEPVINAFEYGATCYYKVSQFNSRVPQFLPYRHVHVRMYGSPLRYGEERPVQMSRPITGTANIAS